jgi:cellobiose phosphorylase
VEPVIPGSWTGFRATRRFRGTTYDIEVVRSPRGDLLNTGPVRLVVDGLPIEGTLIPLPEPGTSRVRVEVMLG